MEKIAEQPQQSFLDNPKIKDFLIDRGIHGSVYELITKLGDFPSDLIVEEMHNRFNLLHERSGQDLQVSIDYIEKLQRDPAFISERDKHKLRRRKELCELMLQFFETYGWEKSYSLIRILEQTVPKKSIIQEIVRR